MRRVLSYRSTFIIYEKPTVYQAEKSRMNKTKFLFNY